MKKISFKKDFRQIEFTVKSLISRHIVDQKVDLIFHDFPPSYEF